MTTTMQVGTVLSVYIPSWGENPFTFHGTKREAFSAARRAIRQGEHRAEVTVMESLHGRMQPHTYSFSGGRNV